MREKIAAFFDKVQALIDRIRPEGGWLASKKFLMAVSLIASVSCWVFITLYVNADSQTTITDIPIRVDTTAMNENFGLEMVAITAPEAISDGKVDVIVTGSAYQISRVTAEDITVSAQTGSVNKAGKYSLSLVLACGNKDVTVALKDSYKTVDVWFDSIMERVFTLEKPLVTGVSVPADSGLIIGEPNALIKTVFVSGPESVVDSIAAVQLQAELDKELNATATVDGTICYIDDEGNVMDSSRTDYIDILDYNDIGATQGSPAGAPLPSDCVISVPIRIEQELRIEPLFRNVPDGFDVSGLKYTVTPASIRLEGDIDVIKKYSEDGVFSVDGIDLSTVTPAENTFVIKLNLSSAVTAIDGLTEVEVKVDMKGCKSEVITVDGSRIQLSGTGGRKVSAASETVDVTVVGPAAVVDRLSPEDITILVDMTGDEWTEGVREKNALVTVGDGSRCWAVGAYTVKVKVEPTQ